MMTEPLSTNGHQMNPRILEHIKKVVNDEKAREKIQVDIIFSRLPLWLQANEIGDRLSDGSDEQSYEPDYQEDKSG